MPRPEITRTARQSTGYQAQLAAQGPTTRVVQHHCLSIDGKGGWDRQRSHTSVVKATISDSESGWFFPFGSSKTRKKTARKSRLLLCHCRSVRKGTRIFHRNPIFGDRHASRLAGGCRHPVTVLSPGHRQPEPQAESLEKSLQKTFGWASYLPLAAWVPERIMLVERRRGGSIIDLRDLPTPTESLPRRTPLSQWPGLGCAVSD
jgi:hypothetical protein